MRIAIGLCCLLACGHNNHGDADAPTGSDAPADAPPDAAGCGTLAAKPADVYVAAGSTEDSIGTAACPFHTILEATALPAPDAAHPRTIHVATGQYAETGLIQLTGALTLAGAGAAQVTLAGGGHCVFA